MARELPSEYTDTLTASAITRAPLCKVEVEYEGSWHDLSADTLSAAVAHTMEHRAGEAQVVVADPDHTYRRMFGAVNFWSGGSADAPLREGHRVRVWLTNSPADYIRAFQGYIVQTRQKIERARPEACELSCIDAGWKAWEREITMEPRTVETHPTGADREINAIVAAILKHPAVGFTDETIGLAAHDSYQLLEWKPSTFRPMQAIDDLLDCVGYRLRFDHAGEAVSFDWNPAGDPAWTYGSAGERNLILSFEMRSRPPRELANKVRVIGRKWGDAGDTGEDTLMWSGDLYWGQQDYGDRPCVFLFGGSHPTRWPNGDITAYVNIEVSITGGHTDDFAWARYDGIDYTQPPPYPGKILVMPWGTVHGDDYITVEVRGDALYPTSGTYTATRTVTQLTGHGYSGELVVENDLLKDDDACADAATRAATWLMDEMFPCTLVVPANLCHEPGDKIRVYQPTAGAGNTVDFIVVTHRIEYERGKPNLSVLELVPDFYPTIA